MRLEPYLAPEPAPARPGTPWQLRAFLAAAVALVVEIVVIALLNAGVL
jgi:hypothetical protein